MVMIRKPILVGFLCVCVVAGGGVWWVFRETRIPAEEFYHPEEFPEFSLALNDTPLGSQIPVEPYWVITVKTRPPVSQEETRFEGIVIISPPGDDRSSYAFVVLKQQHPDGPRVSLSVLRDGVITDVTPEMPAPDSPWIQLCGLLTPGQFEQERVSGIQDLVGLPLTMWVWMYPLDDQGRPQFPKGLLVLKHEFQFVVP